MHHSYFPFSPRVVNIYTIQDKKMNNNITNDTDNPANTSDYEGSDTNMRDEHNFWNEINFKLINHKQSTTTTPRSPSIPSVDEVNDETSVDDCKEPGTEQTKVKARSSSPTSPPCSTSSSRSASRSPSFDNNSNQDSFDFDYDSGIGNQPTLPESCICEEDNLNQYRFLKCSCKLNNKAKVLKKKQRESNINLRKNSISGCEPWTTEPQFSRSSVGGSKFLLSCHPTLEPSDLIFESRFESGNLAKAVKITPTYYELYLRPDMYTNRHTQWYYFRVKNTKKGVVYR